MEGQFFNVIFIFLIVVLIVITFKNPREILIGIPLGFIKHSILHIPYNISENSKADIIYPSTGKLKVNFENGEKSLAVFATRKRVETGLKEFIEYSNVKYRFQEFEITEIETAIEVKCPARITFYDFHLLVQSLTEVSGEKSCYGSFKSSEISYSVYQDTKTLNNLLGYTDNNKNFSIYILDENIEEEYLSLNQKLPVERKWIEEKMHVC